MIYRIILRLIIYVYIDDDCSFYPRGQKYNLAPLPELYLPPYSGATGREYFYKISSIFVDGKILIFPRIP